MMCYPVLYTVVLLLLYKTYSRCLPLLLSTVSISHAENRLAWIVLMLDPCIPTMFAAKFEISCNFEIFFLSFFKRKNVWFNVLLPCLDWVISFLPFHQLNCHKVWSEKNFTSLKTESKNGRADVLSWYSFFFFYHVSSVERREIACVLAHTLAKLCTRHKLLFPLSL